MVPFPDPPDDLRDDRVALRLAADRDIPEVLIAHQDDRTLHRRLGSPRPPSGAELGRRVERSAAERAAGTDLWLTVLAPGSDECRGQLDVSDVDPDRRRGSLSVWIAPRDRRRGLGSGALSLAARWLLGDGGLARIQLLIDPGDEAIRGAALGAGLRSEGVLRGHLLGADGRRADVEMFALVAADVDVDVDVD